MENMFAIYKMDKNIHIQNQGGGIAKLQGRQSHSFLSSWKPLLLRMCFLELCNMVSLPKIYIKKPHK